MKLDARKATELREAFDLGFDAKAAAVLAGTTHSTAKAYFNRFRGERAAVVVAEQFDPAPQRLPDPEALEAALRRLPAEMRDDVRQDIILGHLEGRYSRSLIQREALPQCARSYMRTYWSLAHVPLADWYADVTSTDDGLWA